MTHRFIFLFILLATSVAPPPVALGQAPPPGPVTRPRARPSLAMMAESRRRFMRANKLYRKGNYTEALLVYQAALDLYRGPAILYNMAQTYEKLRNPAQAAHHFEVYLQTNPKAKDRKAVLKRIERLKLLAKVDVHVTSYPPGAAIYVGSRKDGVKGRTPSKLALPLGKQRVTVQLAGFIAEERVIEVRLGRRNLVDVQLRRRSSIKVDADVPGSRATIITPKGKQSRKAPHLFELDPGSYPITVELQGYHPVKHRVELGSGEQISLLVNLKPLPKYGKLQVVGVAGATVVKEGLTFAHLPMEPKQIPEGTYLISVSREDYRTWEARVNVTANHLTVARVKLIPVQGTVTKTVIYSSAGLAAASLVTGAILGVLAYGTEQDYKGGSADVDTMNKGRAQAMACDIFLGVAGVAAVTATVTYFATRRGPSTADVTFSNISAPQGPLK